MNYSIFTEVDWLYPDSTHSEVKTMNFDLPVNGHCSVQILGETLTSSNIKARFLFSGDTHIKAKVSSLRAVRVDENTSPKLMTTTDYESCKEFVTREAPFYVYDAICPLSELKQGDRLALFVTVTGSKSESVEGELELEIGEEIIRIPFSCKVYDVAVKPIDKAKLGMLNFFDYDEITRSYQVEKYSEAYWEHFREYVKAELELRITHLMLPVGEAVYKDGKLTGFDFTAAVRAGRIAIEEGAPMLCGGHIAHWNEWTDIEYYPVWDKTLGVTTDEGYFQVALYFKTWKDVIEKEGWSDKMTQSLADEPQTKNENTYRVLSAMFRKFLPNIPILEAVETTNLGGGVDIWVPKQDTYEKHKEAFDKLKDFGEEMWYYTCAFPAGPAMNRSMDLPLTVSRLILWMGAKYRFTGFLHWGFNFYIGENVWEKACCPHKGELLPAGDAHIVYPNSPSPYRSVRFMEQRGGVEDFELFALADEIDKSITDSVIDEVCETFFKYTSSGEAVMKARKRLLSLLEEHKNRA